MRSSAWAATRKTARSLPFAAGVVGRFGSGITAFLLRRWRNAGEDAATAEISRAEVWQWIRHGAKLANGRTVKAALCCAVLDEELRKLSAAAGDDGGNYEDAARLFCELIEAPHFVEFLTLPAYDLITANLG